LRVNKTLIIIKIQYKSLYRFRSQCKFNSFYTLCSEAFDRFFFDRLSSCSGFDLLLQPFVLQLNIKYDQ